MEDDAKPLAHPMFKPVEKKGVPSRQLLEKMRNQVEKFQTEKKDQITIDLDKKLFNYINSKRKSQAAVNVNLTATGIIKNISSTEKSTTNYASLVVTTSLMVTTMATSTNPYDQPVCKSLGLGKKTDPLNKNHIQEPKTSFTHVTGCPPGWIERSITGVKKCFKYSDSGGQSHVNSMKACCEMNGKLPSVKKGSNKFWFLSFLGKNPGLKTESERVDYYAAVNSVKNEHGSYVISANLDGKLA